MRFQSIKAILVTIPLVALGVIHSHASRLDGKTITFAEFFNAILDNEKMEFSDHSKGRKGAYLSVNGFCLYDDISFQFNRTTDDPWDQRYSKGGEVIHVKKSVDFLQCHFDEVYWLLFNNMVFDESFSIQHCTGIKFLFKDCVFKNALLSTNLNQIDFIEFENCTFERGFA